MIAAISTGTVKVRIAPYFLLIMKPNLTNSCPAACTRCLYADASKQRPPCSDHLWKAATELPNY